MSRDALCLAERDAAAVDERDFLGRIRPACRAGGALVEVEQLARKRQLYQVLGRQLDRVLKEHEHLGAGELTVEERTLDREPVPDMCGGGGRLGHAGA